MLNTRSEEENTILYSNLACFVNTFILNMSVFLSYTVLHRRNTWLILLWLCERHDIIFKFSLFCEYIHLEYERVPVIYSVTQAEYLTHIVVAVWKEYVHTYPTRKMAGLTSTSGTLYTYVYTFIYLFICECIIDRLIDWYWLIDWSIDWYIYVCIYMYIHISIYIYI